MTGDFRTQIACGVLVEYRDRIVMVREMQPGEGEVWNQPAGRLDPNEDLPTCAVRETWEEAGLHIELTGVLGVYVWPKSPDLTWLRVCYLGQPTARSLATTGLDGMPVLQPQEVEPVLEARWFARPELDSIWPKLRSPVTARCLHDYYGGQRFPLHVVTQVIEFLPVLGTVETPS